MRKYEIFDGLNKLITTGYEQDEDSALWTCLNYIDSKANDLNTYFSEGFYKSEHEYVTIYFVEDKEGCLAYTLVITEVF